MMMPANYSAIAENEMTYVVGGGVIEWLGDRTAPIWDASNVKTFNTNIITMIGNTYSKSLVRNTLGQIFAGYGANTTKAGLKTGLEKVAGFSVVDKKVVWSNGVGTAVANWVGTLAAIYNMGRTTVGVTNVPSTTQWSDGDGIDYVIKVIDG